MSLGAVAGLLLGMGPLCPSGYATMVARMEYAAGGKRLPLRVCESFAGGGGNTTGDVLFLAVGGDEGWPLRLHKRVAANRVANDSAYGNWSKAQVLTAATDVLGNGLLGIHGHPKRATEPTLREVAELIPPLRSIRDARVWTANRESGRDATFDAFGVNRGMGTPSPVWVARALPGFASTAFDREGLIGNLPALVLSFPVGGNGTEAELLEMTVVPVANGTGREQPVLLRFVSANATSTRGEAVPPALIFDTFVRPALAARLA